ncbi:G-type lectin S-receptor-like serine/threonine-protein kinase LECRK3 [Tanacetum coccineum]
MLLSSITEVGQSIGVFKLKMQVDGNLVRYPNVGTGYVASSSYLSSGTAWAGPNVTLNLDYDGFLYLLQNSTYLIRNLTQGGYPKNNTIYRLKIDVDVLCSDYIACSKVLHQLRSYKYMAQVLKTEGHIGIAIGLIKQWLNNVQKKDVCGIESWQMVIKENIDSLTALLKRLSRRMSSYGVKKFLLTTIFHRYKGKRS